MAKVTMLRCGTCGKRYSNPLQHVCRTRLDRKRKPGKTKVKPTLTFTCRTCGKATNNPLTHTCRIRTDFRRRKAAHARQTTLAAKRRRAAATRRATGRARKKPSSSKPRTTKPGTTKPGTGASTGAKTAAPRPSLPSFGSGSLSPQANHDYRECFQASRGSRTTAAQDCGKYPCRVYAEGHDAGLETGRALGHATGYGEGYTAGYAHGHHEGHQDGLTDGTR